MHNKLKHIYQFHTPRVGQEHLDQLVDLFGDSPSAWVLVLGGENAPDHREYFLAGTQLGICSPLPHPTGPSRCPLTSAHKKRGKHLGENTIYTYVAMIHQFVYLDLYIDIDVSPLHFILGYISKGMED